MNIGSGPLRRTVLTLAAVALLSSACVPDVGPTAVDVQFGKGGIRGGPKEDPPPPPVYSDSWEPAHDIGYRTNDGAWILIDSSEDQDERLDPFRMDPTITNDGGVGPTWTPYGDLLIWGDDGVSVIRQDSNGSEVEHLFNCVNCTGLPPVWSPDGTMIAFGKDDGSGGNDLWVQPVGVNGIPSDDMRQVSHEPTRGKISVRWGPESKRIATLDDENNFIVIYDVTQQQPDDPRVLELGGEIHIFEWARTQDRFVTFSGGNIWIIDFKDDLNYCNLTSGTSLGARDPTWSPDDSFVLFARKHSAKRNQRAANDLVKVSVLGSGEGRVGAGCNTNLDWYEETILVEAPDSFVRFTDWSRWGMN